MRTEVRKAATPSPAQVTRAFAKVLRELRKEKGLSQEALGFESGLHRTYVSQIERGEKQPTISTLFKLAAALGCKSSDLMHRTEDRLRKP